MLLLHIIPYRVPRPDGFIPLLAVVSEFGTPSAHKRGPSFLIMYFTHELSEHTICEFKVRLLSSEGFSDIWEERGWSDWEQTLPKRTRPSQAAHSAVCRHNWITGWEPLIRSQNVSPGKRSRKEELWGKIGSQGNNWISRGMKRTKNVECQIRSRKQPPEAGYTLFAFCECFCKTHHEI